MIRINSKVTLTVEYTGIPTDSKYSEILNNITNNLLNPHNTYNRIINCYSRGLKDITSHGVDHSLRLIQDIIGRAYENWQWDERLTEKELFILYAASWFHDIGMIINRENHYEFSKEIIEKILAPEFNGLFLIGSRERELITTVVWAHSSQVNINSIPERRYDVRLRGITALFRIFDSCDVTEERAPKRIYDIIHETMDEKSKKFWEAHQQISALEFKAPNIIKIIKTKNANNELLIRAIEDIEKEIKVANEILDREGFPIPTIEIPNIEHP